MIQSSDQGCRGTSPTVGTGTEPEQQGSEPEQTRNTEQQKCPELVGTRNTEQYFQILMKFLSNFFNNIYLYI